MNDKGLHFIDTVVPMPLMGLPVRTVWVELEKANLLISPGSRMTESDYKSLPRMDDLIANNGFHNAGIPKAREHYPDARVWGVAGTLHPHLLDETTWIYQEELPLLTIQGMPRINEAVFLHRSSRTLLVADLCFNLIRARGLGARLILGLFGTYKKFGVSRLWLKGITDRKAFTRSIDRLLKLEFDNLVMAHGDPVIGSAREKLQAALRERGF